MGVNKVEYYGETLMDTTETTVSEDTLMEGETAINAAGEKITGNLKPVKYTAQNPTEEEQAQARKNIDALGTTDLPEAVNAALSQAKESGEFKGEPGAAGVGIANIEQVTVSEEDGGENVWRATLTNEQTADFVVKNGKKGEPGEPGATGKTAYEYAQDGGYTGSEEDFMEMLANGTGGGSGVADKAFNVEKSNTITWDGNTAGLANIGDIVYKVSEEAPTKEKASLGGYFKYIDNETPTVHNFTSSDVNEWNDDIYAIYGNDFGTIVVVSKDGSSYDSYTGLEKGVYVSSENNKYITEVMFNGYQFSSAVLKESSLPKHKHSWKELGENELETGGNTITSDDVIYGRYRKISDAVPTLEEVQKGGTLSYYNVTDGAINGELITAAFPEGLYTIGSTNEIEIRYDGYAMVVISTDGNSDYSDITEPGVYFIQGSLFLVHSLKINDYAGFPTTEINKIPEEYLPDGGGVSSWNDLTDKPFGETTVMGDTLTWDGNTEGLESVVLESLGATLLRISDTAPTIEAFANGWTLSAVSEGETLMETVASENVVESEDLIFPMMGEYLFIIAPFDGAKSDEEGVTLEKAGVYVTLEIASQIGITSLAMIIPNYTGFETTEIKTIDPKYLPSGAGGGGVEIVDFAVDISNNNATTCNKTFEEIKAMISSGVYVVARISGLVQADYIFAPVTGVVSEGIAFTQAFNTSGKIIQVAIMADGTANYDNN